MWRGEELGKKSDSISPNKYCDNMFPILAGNNVRRYETPTIDKWILYNNINKDISNYNKHKILIRQLGSTINATIDCDRCITLQSVYCLIPSHSYNDDNLFAYLGLLNSKLYSFLYNYMSGDKQTFQRIILENIKALPVPNISKLFNSNIGKYSKDILYNKDKINITDIENKIDDIVYKLFNLSDTEVKTIELSK